jgi:pilus assembly protein CpaC
MTLRASLLFLGLLAGAAPAMAQQAVPMARPAVAAVPLSLPAGTGRLVTLPRAAASVLAADSRIARVQPVSPTSLFVMAVAPGRSTVIATSEDGTPVAQFDLTVTGEAPGAAPRQPGERAEGEAPRRAPNAAALQAAIRRVLPGADGVTVTAIPGGVALSGHVATPAEAHQVRAMARADLGEGAALIDSLGVLSSVQVNVRVRVAEISRQLSRELGFNWQALGNAGGFLFGFRAGSPIGLGAAALTSGLVGSGAATGALPARALLGYSGSRFDVNSVIDALAADQLITILAEPNLTAQSGETASFLAGGEFPVPVAAGTNNTVTIEFKQFGISLAFVPTVLAPDRLNLRVRPEVSELSDNGAINLPVGGGSLRIPALTVRRAETTVELGSGESFAIAGLLQRSTTQTADGPLGLSEVPVLGALFRSSRFRRNETELVIIVTPYLVRATPNPQALAAPTDGFRPASETDRILRNRQVAQGSGPAGARRGAIDAGFIVE